jgi:hypothetical protein
MLRQQDCISMTSAARQIKPLAQVSAQKLRNEQDATAIESEVVAWIKEDSESGDGRQ